jgi:putative ABC transport system permease protein
MIFRNLLIAWRNIRKKAILSIINIAGLSIGIAVVTLILFWVVDELSYDKFHKNIDQIYSVYEHQQYSDGQELYTYCTTFPLGKELLEKYSEIKNATTFCNVGDQLIRVEDKEFKVSSIVCADNEFLNVFSFEIVDGDKNTLLSPDKIIINEKTANQLFGDQSVPGKSIILNDEYTFTIGAVARTEGNNTNVGFNILAPITLMEKAFGSNLESWGNNWPRTSIVLSENTDVKSLDEKIVNVIKEKGQENTTIYLFPFQKERLYSYSGRNNRIQYVYQFLAIAFIIILIASINFINLSTAKAEQRRPEVGIRKVMGAGKLSILNQFLLENGIMILLSILFSIILVFLFIPAFSSISGKQVTFSLIQNKYMIYLLGGVVITVLGLSVIYPSIYVSKFNALQAIKKTLSGKHHKIGLRNLLVVIQFVLSVILISSTLIVFRQLNFLNNYDLGYNQANLIYLPLSGEAKNKQEALRQEFNRISGIVNFTRTDRIPFYGGNSSWGFDWQGKDPENKVLICSMQADRNYFETMGIELAEGNNFPENYSEVLNIEDVKNSLQVILNQEAIKRMQIIDPIGKYFGTGDGDVKAVIRGVATDFHFESLHVDVEPMLIIPLINEPGYIIARIDPAGFSQTLDKIKDLWAKVLPQSNCEIRFFDDRLESMYNSEVRISELFKYFSFIAIFISCIGLFGLSLFVIELKRKEIGIRKINGAKVGEVIFLLNKDFIRWVIIAFIIACPVTWLVMNRWLENFAFKTNLSLWIFALAGVMALGIALLTVSWQSWKAATRNPVEALRYE